MSEIEEQFRILKLCHIDPIAGHLGEKKTISRISKQFVWTGIVKDVKQMDQVYIMIIVIPIIPISYYYNPMQIYLLVLYAKRLMGK